MSSLRTKLLLALSALALGAVYVLAVVLFSTKDRVDQLDSDALKAVAGPACLTLRGTIDAMPVLPPGTSNADRSARVDEQAAAVERFVAQVRTVGPQALADDSPAESWLADWESLIRIRKEVAASDFALPFQIPMGGDDLVTRRMNDIGIDACQVPMGLTTAP